MSGNLIKDENLRLLRQVLREEKEATKSQLAKKTGLSVVTIQSLMQTLLSDGEAEEGELVQPKLGRPAVVYRFRECARLALVIYMYVKDKIDTAVYQVYDLYGNCMEQQEEGMQEVTDTSYDVMISKFLFKYPAISVIAIGLPVVAGQGGILASDYPKLLNVDLECCLKEKFKRKIFIENDINAAVLGYAASHDEGMEGCIAGIYMPTKYPPGAGICLDGKVQKGRNGMIGEIKFLHPDMDWNRFSYEKEAVEEYLLLAVRNICCLYNPDRLVVYSEVLDDIFLEKLVSTYTEPLERLLLPQIQIKSQLREDFAAGMRQLVLEEIR